MFGLFKQSRTSSLEIEPKRFTRFENTHKRVEKTARSNAAPAPSLPQELQPVRLKPMKAKAPVLNTEPSAAILRAALPQRFADMEQQGAA